MFAAGTSRSQEVMQSSNRGFVEAVAVVVICQLSIGFFRGCLLHGISDLPDDCAY